MSAHGLQLFVDLVGQQRRDHAARSGIVARQHHQLRHLLLDEAVHALLVALGDGEIAGRHLDLVVAQMLAQQEGIQAGHRVQQLEHPEVPLQRFFLIIARGAQGIGYSRAGPRTASGRRLSDH